MKFSIDDDTVLRVSAISSALFAAHCLAAPEDFQKLYYSATTPTSNVSTRWMGMAEATSAASEFVLSVSDNTENKKLGLKTAGAFWAASAAMMLYNAEEGHQKKNISYAVTAGKAAMSALCLWRGFCDEEETKVE